ncbi:MAG: ATP-binding protein [Planctomycetota bacterium]
MERERWIIEADPRHTTRRIRLMQGNAIRALVELITNGDDSYTRLEEQNIPCEGLIEVIYKKDGYRGLFSVRDHAEGMSIEDIRNSFKKYGKATSGMEMGRGVRGYFGQGAKDALAGMMEGKICTFKDNEYVELRLFIENGKPCGEIEQHGPAASGLREMCGIKGNGTIAYFTADPQKTGTVPQFNTVHEELANNYLLRKIVTNRRRKVVLHDGDRGKERRLRYQMPEGDEILSEDFTVSYGQYGDFPIHVSIWRAPKELTQRGDDRTGGLLLVDDEDVPLGITLFRYDNEPLAANFYGEVRIGRFRELLKAEEAVLSEERDGLIPRHPFCQLLIPVVEKRIEEKIKEERARRQKEARSKIDQEENSRYRRAFSLLNEIAELEAEPVTNLADRLTGQLELPNGFAICPSSAQITVGKRYAFQLCVDTEVVRHGSIVKVSCTHPKIQIINREVKISTDNGTGILRKYITVKGTEPNIEGTIRATAGSNIAEAKVYVVPEKELLLEEGMVFQPETLTLRPNQPRRVSLLVYVKRIFDGSTISISSDNESIHISDTEITVNEADATRHVAKYQLEVWGEGTDQDAVVTAEFENCMALLQVRVRSKDEQEQKGRQGMFKEPDFNYDLEPHQRSQYSAETGKVIIYVNFPSVQHYLGEECQYRKTLPAQILIADLVAERCFYEIAQMKVQKSGAVIRPEAIYDRIQRDAYELSKKYGKKVHQALVDQKMLQDAISSGQS